MDRTRRPHLVVVAVMAALLAATLAAAQPALAAGHPHDGARSGDASVDSQIIGGRPATDAEAVGVAAVLARDYDDAREALICSGSLVAAGWVLTAAHCVDDLSPGGLEVLVGTADLTAGGERIHVAPDGVVVHPDYEVRDDGWFADLALLRLARPSTAEPITLAGSQHWADWAPGEDLTVLGWGQTDRGEIPERLQAATLPAERLAACKALLGAAFDAATMLCGGPEGIGICVGDSGGPLVAGGDAARQVGVASAGAEAGCGLAEPDTYTDITAFGGWLRSETGDAVAVPTRAAVRLHGTDRYATAAAISRHTFDRAKVVYVATGEDFPDGLAAGPVAARRDAPLLLSAGERLPEATAEELQRLDPEEIVLVGGPRTLSEGVARELRAIAPTSRVMGRNRYETAAALSHEWPGTSTQVVLATGEAFPDALAGVSLAARVGPLLLTHPDGLPPSTVARLVELLPERIFVLGGEQAVPEAVRDQLSRIVPDAEIERISGPTRYDTAAAIAAHPGHWPAPRLLYVATGRGFSDALAGGVAAASNRAPLVLTEPGALPAATRAVAETAGARPVVIGGGGAVDEAVVGDLNRLFRR